MKMLLLTATTLLAIIATTMNGGEVQAFSIHELAHEEWEAFKVNVKKSIKINL